MLYRMKPCMVEAVQWQGNNQKEISLLLGKFEHHFSTSEPKVIYVKQGNKSYIVKIGQVILKTEVEGLLYVVDALSFYKAYEPVGKTIFGVPIN